MFQATTHFSQLELVQLALPFLGSIVLMAVMAAERITIGRSTLIQPRTLAVAGSVVSAAPQRHSPASNDDLLLAVA